MKRTKLKHSKKKIKVFPLKELIREDYKKTLREDWFSKAWEESKRIEVERKADELKYLVRRLYDLLYK